MPSLEELLRENMRLASGIIAKRTNETYAENWLKFTQWCILANRQALPATAETVALFLTSILADRKVKTARIYLSAILHHHRKHGVSPPDTAPARVILMGAQRLRGERPVQKSALSIGQLREMIRHIRLPDPWLTRDRAVLLFGFATALRRTSIADMRLSHLGFPPQGMIVHIPREKQDQAGAGRDIGIPLARDPEMCAVRAIRDWLKLRGDRPGYLFDGLRAGNPRAAVIRNDIFRPDRRMHDTVNAIVKHAVHSIGLDPARYGAHSLRAGFITSALESGAGEILTARHTGHHSLATLRLYMRPENPFSGNVCQIIGL